MPNKALHRTVIPLRSVAAGEPGRQASHRGPMSCHVAILRSAHRRLRPIELDEARAAASDLGWTFRASPPPFALKREEKVCTLRYDHGEIWAKTPDQRYYIIGFFVALGILGYFVGKWFER